jgi:hypothetical protein
MAEDTPKQIDMLLYRGSPVGGLRQRFQVAADAVEREHVVAELEGRQPLTDNSQLVAHFRHGGRVIQDECFTKNCGLPHRWSLESHKPLEPR